MSKSISAEPLSEGCFLEPDPQADNCFLASDIRLAYRQNFCSFPRNKVASPEYRIDSELGMDSLCARLGGCAQFENAWTLGR